MDIADQAAEQEDRARQAALAHRQKPGPAYTGFCANCGEAVAMTLRWCDADCKEDWTKREGR